MAAEGSNLLLDATVYLSATVIAVPLAKRLGLGSVLGYLLAGVAIGPWGLRIVTDSQSILHFAEFGVVLLLFLSLFRKIYGSIPALEVSPSYEITLFPAFHTA